MKRTLIVNRLLSLMLLLAGLGLLYESFNNQSWFIKTISDVLKPPEKGGREINLTVGGEPKISVEGENNQESSENKSPANLGAKDLSLENSSNSEKINPNEIKIELTSLKSDTSYPEDLTGDGLLKLKNDCWIEIKDKSNKVLISGHNKKGKEIKLERNKAPFSGKAVCKPENLDFSIEGLKQNFKSSKKGSAYQLDIEF